MEGNRPVSASAEINTASSWPLPKLFVFPAINARLPNIANPLAASLSRPPQVFAQIRTPSRE